MRIMLWNQARHMHVCAHMCVRTVPITEKKSMEEYTIRLHAIHVIISYYHFQVGFEKHVPMAHQPEGSGLMPLTLIQPLFAI